MQPWHSHPPLVYTRNFNHVFSQWFSKLFLNKILWGTLFHCSKGWAEPVLRGQILSTSRVEHFILQYNNSLAEVGSTIYNLQRKQGAKETLVQVHVEHLVWRVRSPHQWTIMLTWRSAARLRFSLDGIWPEGGNTVWVESNSVCFIAAWVVTESQEAFGKERLHLALQHVRVRVP